MTASGIISTGILGFRNQLLPFFQAGNVILNKQGLFVYSGKPGIGNLIFSSVGTAANQTDKFGNKILPNTTCYTGGSTAINFVGGTMEWFNGSFAAGWNFTGIFIQQNGFGSGVLDIAAAGINLGSIPVVVSGNSNPTHHFPTSQMEVQGDIVSWANAVALTFHSQISGDTFDRFALDSNGKHNWGTGAAATDTDLYRSGVNALETDGLFLAQSTVQSFVGFQALVNAGTSPAIEIVTLLAANARWYADGNGKMWWGVGGATAVDTDFGRVVDASSNPVLHSDNGGEFLTLNIPQNTSGAHFGVDSGGNVYRYNANGNHTTDEVTVGGHCININSVDSNTYSTETLHNSGYPAQLVNFTAPATMTGSGVPVAAQRYKFKAHIWCSTTAAGGAPTFNWVGPAVTGNSFSDATYSQQGVQTGVIVRANLSLNSLGAGQTLASSGFTCELRGEATFSAAGTLSINVSTSAVADTFTVNYFTVELTPLG